MGYLGCTLCFLSQFISALIFGEPANPMKLRANVWLSILASLGGISSIVTWKGMVPHFEKKINVSSKNVSSKNVSLCRQGTWETTDIVMSSLFPRNKLAQILVPFGFGLPILVSLGVYNTASFRGVARLPEDNYSLFPVVYKHPLRDPSSNYQNLDQ